MAGNTVVYVLTTPMPELLEDATVGAIRIRTKWENDDYIAKGSSIECHLRIEESLRAQDSDKGKGKGRVTGPSVNMAEEVDAHCRGGLIPVLQHMAVVRLPDPKRKTFGEKVIDCIFVGYAEHSKAYRFYVIEPNDSISINSIIESRDAIFDENLFSSIPRPNDIIPNSDESQRDNHSDDVPSEIPEPRKGCKWIFKRKMKVDGTIEKFKAQLLFTICDPSNRCQNNILNGDLKEEVYMKQPGEFVMPVNEHKECNLVKSLYGLKQAPKQYSVKDMEEAAIILGIKIKRRNKGIIITQSHYIEKILKKFN
ncbi:zinc finger, CCHC-type containing protein [Tanacetum coccineum]